MKRGSTTTTILSLDVVLLTQDVNTEKEIIMYECRKTKNLKNITQMLFMGGDEYFNNGFYTIKRK